jgi:UDP-N-acetylglucosamine:LPS N-acetylglucosamine transferase
LGAPERLEGMGRAARGLGRPDAAARVADLVEEHARVE